MAVPTSATATVITTVVAEEVVVGVVGAIRWRWWGNVVVDLRSCSSRSKESGLDRAVSINVPRGLLTKKKFMRATP
jgi:hypothetical protein